MTHQIRVHNPRPEPVVYRADGRVLDGFRTGNADTTDTVTTLLVDRGRLILCGTWTTGSTTTLVVDVEDETQPEADEPVGAPEPVEDLPVGDPEEVLPEPGLNASKADWQDYALSQGHAWEDIKHLTRNQLTDLEFPADRGHESDHQTHETKGENNL